MPTRIVTAAAVAMAFVCPAHAETRLFVTIDDSDRAEPALIIPAPARGKLDRVHLRADTNQGHASIVLELSSKERDAHEIATTLDVPRGSRVTGMAVTIGGARSRAHVLSAVSARERYRSIVERKADPALLELAGSTRSADRLSLRVFPVAKSSPARVEIELQLPDVGAVALDTPAQLAVELDGKPSNAKAIALRPRPWMATDTAVREHVTLLTSLFADAPAGPMPTVTIGATWSSCGFDVSVDARTIRKQVKLAHPRLTHCWLREAQRDPTLEGSAVMHFVIMRDGRTQGISVDGTLDDAKVRACIADEIATWKFHESTTIVQVNYPIEFRLLD